MKTKFLAALLAALSLSAIFTFANQQSKTSENVYYYPATYEFYVGSVILLVIFIFFAIPLSFVADMLIYHRAKQNGRHVLSKPLLYILLAIGLGACLLLFKRTFHIKTMMNTLFYFALCGGTFLFYQSLITYLQKVLRRY